MSYRVILATSFKDSLRKLKKRYRRVKEDIKPEIAGLTESPREWPVMPGSGGVRKARVSNSDAKKGKSGGYRLLYFVEDDPKQMVYVLWIYSKSDRDDVTKREVKMLVAEARAELAEE